MQIRIGGLMRCCIKSLQEDRPTNPQEGDVRPCKWCDATVIYKFGAWEWNREKETV